VTSGFFRIQMLVAMGLSVLAALTGQVAEATAGIPSSGIRDSAAVIGLLRTSVPSSGLWDDGKRELRSSSRCGAVERDGRLSRS
jgi:hypothetical protein